MQVISYMRRFRPAVAAIVLGAALFTTAGCGALAAAAPPVGVEERAIGAFADAVALERGRSAAAEAAVDDIARGLSGRQGYAPDRFSTRIYSIPHDSEHAITESFDMALQGDGQGWRRAPQFDISGANGGAAGWTRDGDREALVVGYGRDGETGRMFVAVLRAMR